MSGIRIVSYAINGRGMGHLVRQLAILRWIRRYCDVLGIRCEAWVLTSSEADTLARREGVPALKIPSKAMLRDSGIEPTRYLGIARGWVLNAIAGLAPDLLLVDTFPGGSFGELAAALELAKRRVLVARRVRDEFAAEDPYRALLPLFHETIAPDARGVGPILLRSREELLGRDEARRALGVQGDQRTVYLTLGGGGDRAAAGLLPRACEALRAANWHVVVGAGPLYEGEELRGPGITWMDRYVPMELFAGLDAAVSAGGYNSFHELMHAGVPTVFMPQARIADDQHERVQRAVAAGAGRIVDQVDQLAEALESPGTAEAAKALVPTNGAQAAALLALRDLIPAADLEVAQQLFAPWLTAALRKRSGASPRKALELVRLLAGPTPSHKAQLQAAVGEAAALGAQDDAAGGRDQVIRGVFDVLELHGVPLDTGLVLVRALARKFPGASAAQLRNACEDLIPAWARFDDWMGAVSLMRAVPAQRTLALSRFVAELCSWLNGQEDLFDALREFSQLEAGGQRSVAEVLALLCAEREVAQ